MLATDRLTATKAWNRSSRQSRVSSMVAGILTVRIDLLPKCIFL